MEGDLDAVCTSIGIYILAYDFIALCGPLNLSMSDLSL